MEKIFDLEYQYQLYLKRVALSKNKMPPIQDKELRQAFMGACGQILLMLRDDIGKLEEDEAIKVMENMIGQVGNYFLKITNKQN